MAIIPIKYDVIYDYEFVREPNEELEHLLHTGHHVYIGYQELEDPISKTLMEYCSEHVCVEWAQNREHDGACHLYWSKWKPDALWGGQEVFVGIRFELQNDFNAFCDNFIVEQRENSWGLVVLERFGSNYF